MPSRVYHEALWRDVPAGLAPPDFALRRRFLLNAVQPGERVLDVGCGEGQFAVELTRAGAKVVGIDVAQEPLSRARAQDAQLDMRLVDAEGPWPLDDASFDVVWAGEVVEHVADVAGWLSQLRRVLVPRGRVLLSTPGHGRLAVLALALSASAFDAHFDPRCDHLRFYTRRTLRSLLEDFGFGEIDVREARRLSPAGGVLLAAARRSRF